MAESIETELPSQISQDMSLVDDFIKDIRTEMNQKRKSPQTECVDINLTITKEEQMALVKRLASVFSFQKSPIQVLHELFQGSNLELSVLAKGSYGPPHEPLHITCVSIQNIGTFMGKAKSKQESRQQAAQMAIEFINSLSSEVADVVHAKKTKKSKKLPDPPASWINQALPIDESMFEETPTLSVMESVPVPESVDAESLNEQVSQVVRATRQEEVDKNLANAIEKAVLKKWWEKFSPDQTNALVDKLVTDEQASKGFKSKDLYSFKEMAAFVITSDKCEDFLVLSLGTGTKCVTSKNLSLNGEVLHDSHAEILARRGFLQVLYDQIEALLDNNHKDKDDFILEPTEDGERFRLKPHLKLCLFITSAPCGGARIYNFSQIKCRENSNRGKLRVKIELGQGTIPMKGDYMSTWDALMASWQRNCFMSCSDKITLWNVAGVQGSLLSLFLEPIYLDNLVFGELYNYENSMYCFYDRIPREALCNKLEGLKNFKFNKCKVGSSNEKPIDKKARPHNVPLYSQNWYQSFSPEGDSIEFTLGETGSNLFNSEMSRLCKRKQLQRFLHLIRNYPWAYAHVLQSEAEVTQPVEQFLQNKKYIDLKNLAKDYHQAKTALYTTLRDENLGSWTSAPIDVDLFPVLEIEPEREEDRIPEKPQL